MKNSGGGGGGGGCGEVIFWCIFCHAAFSLKRSGKWHGTAVVNGMGEAGKIFIMGHLL